MSAKLHYPIPSAVKLRIPTNTALGQRTVERLSMMQSVNFDLQTKCMVMHDVDTHTTIQRWSFLGNALKLPELPPSEGWGCIHTMIVSRRTTARTSTRIVSRTSMPSRLTSQMASSFSSAALRVIHKLAHVLWQRGFPCVVWNVPRGFRVFHTVFPARCDELTRTGILAKDAASRRTWKEQWANARRRISMQRLHAAYYNSIQNTISCGFTKISRLLWRGRRVRISYDICFDLIQQVALCRSRVCHAIRMILVPALRVRVMSLYVYVWIIDQVCWLIILSNRKQWNSEQLSRADCGIALSNNRTLQQRKLHW